MNFVKDFHFVNKISQILENKCVVWPLVVRSGWLSKPVSANVWLASKVISNTVNVPLKAVPLFCHTSQLRIKEGDIVCELDVYIWFILCELAQWCIQKLRNKARWAHISRKMGPTLQNLGLTFISYHFVKSRINQILNMGVFGSR